MGALLIETTDKKLRFVYWNIHRFHDNWKVISLKENNLKDWDDIPEFEKIKSYILEKIIDDRDKKLKYLTL